MCLGLRWPGNALSSAVALAGGRPGLAAGWPVPSQESKAAAHKGVMKRRHHSGWEGAQGTALRARDITFFRNFGMFRGILAPATSSLSSTLLSASPAKNLCLSLA